ncbi:MAG TPA: hypothetical protein VG602_01070 [Actinomycetota bacterium]|nr:hypothetical protein [Actinomycetota bacterium]
MAVVRVAVFLAGAALVVAVFGSALRTVVLPRGIPARITRVVFFGMRSLFRLRARPSLPYEQRDRIMALYAPFSLIILLLVWITTVLTGYSAMYWALGSRSIRDAIALSGSSVLTLGFGRPADLPTTVLVFTEAALGLILLAMLITYLPSIYAVFSRRENMVAGMDLRGGSPPSAVEILQRSWRVDQLKTLGTLWRRGEQWFLELMETHTSFPAVVFFRSPVPEHSWVTSAGAILDSASTLLSAVDRPQDPDAEYCLRAGYLALRRIAEFFRIPFDPNPGPEDPISILRDEFDEACDSLAAAGLPLRRDRDQAWRDFVSWRVNYDRVLIALAGLTMAPYAPWSSDRSIRDWRPRATLRELRGS